MPTMTQINDADLAFFDRLAAMASSRRDALLPAGTFFSKEIPPTHDAQYEHMTSMTGYIGCDVKHDYCIALEHIAEMAKHDGIKLSLRDVLYTTGLTLRVDMIIAASMILGALTFMSGEWLVSLLPI